MSEREWYKGTPSSTTALVFGEVFDSRPPNTTTIMLGQRAYEAYSLHPYMEQLLHTRHDATYVDWTPLFSAVYAGLLATNARRVLEVGSTLFATIDKLEKLARLTGAPPLGDVEFVGVEPSSLFCQVAHALHPASRIVHVDRIADVPPGPSVGRSYQATSYAFGTTDELVDACARSAIGVHGIWFTETGETVQARVLGKRLVLFSLPGFLAGMAARGYRVQFIAASQGHRVGLRFHETWLVCHRLAEHESAAFGHWLDLLSAETGETATLFDDWASVPVQHQDPPPAQIDDASRLFDFTTGQAVSSLKDWQRTVAGPATEATTSRS
jgi:hypothetical protein